MTVQRGQGRLDHDVVVIGAGFAGLYMLHRLRDVLGLSVRLLEEADGVGGTWHWCRYPGARCDTESYVYCYSFSKELLQEWEWSGKYPRQPEILSYLNHVADRFALRHDIAFGTRVTAAHFDEVGNAWEVATDQGDVLRARFLVTAVGILTSARYVPDLPGLEDFAGPVYHTGAWPSEPVDHRGLRVGVIGTGSTGVQAIPEIARVAEHLFVFQRTPQYAIPARHESLDRSASAQIKRNYDAIWEVARWSAGGFPFQHNGVSALEVSAEDRTATFERLWSEGGFKFVFGSYRDILTHPQTNALVSSFIRGKIRERIDDARLAAKLVPSDHSFGARRPIIESDYFETYNRPNVTLVDVREERIERLTPGGLLTERREYPLDLLVLATGFDAVTGPYFKIDLRGSGGLPLREKWSAGPRTYVGLATAGFPNMFTIGGPGSTFGNYPVTMEHHVEWIGDCIAHILERGYSRIDVDPEAERAWSAHVEEQGRRSVIAQADSWFNGGNVPGKPRTPLFYLGSFGLYRKLVGEIAARSYEGFLLDGRGAVG